jgi:hypothetical protein
MVDLVVHTSREGKDTIALDYSAAWLEIFSDGKQDSTFKDALWVVRACREF